MILSVQICFPEMSQENLSNHPFTIETFSKVIGKPNPVSTNVFCIFLRIIPEKMNKHLGNIDFLFSFRYNSSHNVEIYMM